MSVLVLESTATAQCSSLMVRCQCCNTPLFEIVGDRLLVKARHHGEWHVTSLALSDFLWYNGQDLKIG